MSFLHLITFLYWDFYLSTLVFTHEQDFRSNFTWYVLDDFFHLNYSKNNLYLNIEETLIFDVLDQCDRIALFLILFHLSSVITIAIIATIFAVMVFWVSAICSV